jgi:hypothetical protein
MQMPKYDIFVCSNKKADPELNMRTEAIMMKLYDQLRRRLNYQGFGNVIFDTMRYMPDYEITREDINALVTNPVFISEHYMTRHITLDPNVSIERVFNMPWRTRPSMDAYAFVNRGKAPMFHAMFVGCTLSGKTYVMNEFKLMLLELDPAIEIIECDNGIKHPEHWDITTDPVEYAAYGERLKQQYICIGGGPRMIVGVDNKPYHNTKI